MTISISFSLSGCMFMWFPGYYGDYPALYTMACHILDTDGYYQDAEFESQAAVVPVETDEYGRTLFAYSDNDYPSVRANYALMICQYYTDEIVYYYQDYNFLLKKPEKENGVVMYIQKLSPAEPSIIKDPLYGFSDGEVALLKERNDWNKPLDKEKCVGNKIFNEYIQIKRKAKELIDNNYKSVGESLRNVLTEYDGYKNTYYKYTDEDAYNNIFLKIFQVYETPSDQSDQEVSKYYKCYFVCMSKSFRLPKENAFVYVGEFEFDSYNFEIEFSFSDDLTYQDALYNFHTKTYWNVCDIDDIIG